MSYAKAKRRNVNALPVLFVMDRLTALAECTAIFPTLPANPGRMVCYSHIGQHSDCSDGWLRDCTCSARPEEYANLLAEVKQIYERDPDPFELVVCRVITSAMRTERIENESPL